MLLLLSGCFILSSAFGRAHHLRRMRAALPNGTGGGPVYVAGNFTFAAPEPFIFPIGHPPSLAFFQADAEPEVIVDLSGNIYVTAIQGVPGGTDLWKSTDKGASFVYLGQPDGAQDHCNPPLVQCNALGGGDDSIDVSSGGYLYVTSLWLGNVTSSASYDGGRGGATFDQMWHVDPAAAVISSDDRQWVAAYGPRIVYLSFASTALTRPPGGIGLFLSKSTDGGQTFAPQNVTEITPATPLDQSNVQGNLVVDQYNGNLYTSFIPNGAVNTINLASSTDGGATWNITTAYGPGPAGTTNRGIFPNLTLDRGGNLHLVFTQSNATDHTNSHIFLTSTANPAAAAPTWTTAVQVDHGAGNVSACEAWAVAGSPGIVNVAWLGSTLATPNDAPTHLDKSDWWNVFFAQVSGALTATPTIAQSLVAPAVHNHSICLNGLGCASANTPHGEPGNRDLLEYFRMSLDPDGNANIAYADSVNLCDPGTCRTNTWFTKQTAGTSAFSLPTAPPAASFGTNVNVAANGGGGAEPNCEVDTHNCIFSAAPGNPDFWKSINNGASFFVPVNPVADENGLTGGDEDILSVPQDTGARPDFLYFADLGITSVHIRKSTDGGTNWAAPGPGGAGGEVSVSSDRMWLDFDHVPAPTDLTVYLMDHEFTTEAIRFSALTDDMAWSGFNSGMTDPELFNPATSTFPNTNPGPVFVDRAAHMVYGIFNASTLGNNAANPPFGKMPNVWEAVGPAPVSAPAPPGPFVNHPVFKGVFDSPTNPAAGAQTIGNNCSNDFPSGAIDNAGNIYVTWAMNDSRTNHFNVWMASSHDHGQHFYGPFQVSSGPGHALMPWIAAGDSGRAEIVFYQTSGTEDPNTSTTDEWNVMFAQSLNAADREPVFTTSKASDHINHIGPICNQGLLCANGTRNLLDFFQVAIGPDGLANIVYAEDNNQGNNVHPEFARQNGGPSGLTNPPTDAITCLGGVSNLPLKAVSSKIHGSNPGHEFEVNLPLTGAPGIECRSGGAGKDYTVIFFFPNPVTASSASVSGGDGMAMADNPPVSKAQTVTVQLHNVNDQQTIMITLHGVDDHTHPPIDVSVPMRVLLGDVNADGKVDGNDVSEVQGHTRQSPNGGTFRFDVNTTDRIDGNDVAFVQGHNR